MAKKNAKQEILVPELKFGDRDFDSEEYNNIALCARLRDVRLTNTDFKIDFKKIKIIEEEENIERNYGGHCAKIIFDIELGVALAEFEWVANIVSGRSKPMKLQAQYVVIFSELENKKEAYVRLYVEKLARFTSYPYYRALFSTLTCSAGLALPPLPTLTDRVD